MRNSMEERELREAIDAGERALSSLRRAQEKLNSARSWGIFDMIGGGTISGIMKHARLSDASRYLEDARDDLRRFQKELQDVSMVMNLRIEIGDFLTFADFFFDGFLADYMVQTKIANARENVSEAISRVSALLGELKRTLNDRV